MKQYKAMIVALIAIYITAIVTALVTRKDLCGVHIRTGQTEVAVFTAYEFGQEQRRGVIPTTLQALTCLQRILVFTLACPRAGFWGG